MQGNRSEEQAGLTDENLRCNIRAIRTAVRVAIADHRKKIAGFRTAYVDHGGSERFESSFDEPPPEPRGNGIAGPLRTLPLRHYALWATLDDNADDNSVERLRDRLTGMTQAHATWMQELYAEEKRLDALLANHLRRNRANAAAGAIHDEGVTRVDEEDVPIEVIVVAFDSDDGAQLDAVVDGVVLDVPSLDAIIGPNGDRRLIFQVKQDYVCYWFRAVRHDQPADTDNNAILDVVLDQNVLCFIGRWDEDGVDDPHYPMAVVVDVGVNADDRAGFWCVKRDQVVYLQNSTIDVQVQGSDETRTAREILRHVAQDSVAIVALQNHQHASGRYRIVNGPLEESQLLSPAYIATLIANASTTLYPDPTWQ